MNAALSRPLSPERVQCRLCRHYCTLAQGQKGRCGVRAAHANGEGVILESLVGYKVAAAHADPVEKKPLYHYLPQTRTFSLGTMGCNFDCAWCQNDNISRVPAETGIIQGTNFEPEQILAQTRHENCKSVAFTYTEPTVFYELMHDTAVLARQEGLGTIMVSNGYQSEEALEGLGPVIQAANIDLKAFRDSTYKTYCKGRLQAVLDSLKYMGSLNWWLEVTTLIIPGMNDSPEELKDIATFIKQELGAGTPWHISAFRPCRNMRDRPSTPPATLLQAWELGKEAGLHFVYMGNIAADDYNTTCCPACHAPLIQRHGFAATPISGFQGICPYCHGALPGIWNLS